MKKTKSVIHQSDKLNKKLQHASDQLKSILGVSLSLAKVNFQLRHEGSYLGILWYLLEPLASFAILLLLGGALRQNNIIPYYPIYIFIGLIIFNFFTSVTTVAITSFISHSGLIKTMKVSKEPFVISILLQFIFSHLFSVGILIFLAFHYHVSLVRFLIYPFIFGFLCLFTLGVSFIVTTIGVYIYDLSNVWNIVNRLWWLVTPVFYSAGKDSALHVLNTVNPLYYFILAARDPVIYNQMPSARVMTVIILGSLFSLCLGLWVFNQFKSNFAEKL